MLTTFRTSLASLIASLDLTLEDGSKVEVWDRVPDDVVALPCVVVGLPEAGPSAQTGVVFDRDLDVYAIGRRVDAGDPEHELTTVTDDLFAGLGGTRNVRHDDQHFTVTDIRHRVIQVAGIDHDAYVITVTSPLSTC